MRIICYTLLLISVIFPLQTFAQQYVTQGNFFACIRKSDLSDMTTFVNNKDYDSAQAYIDQYRCFILKQGLTVTLMDTSWGKVQIAYRGTKIWTYMEAIKSK